MFSTFYSDFLFLVVQRCEIILNSQSFPVGCYWFIMKLNNAGKKVKRSMDKSDLEKVIPLKVVT